MDTQNLSKTSNPTWPQAFLIPIQQSDDKTIEIKDFLTIGRSYDNGLILPDAFVSSRHARIEKRAQGYVLKDMRSQNGTSVNGTKVVEAYLHNNDRVLIGETCFLFSKFKVPENPLQSRNALWNEQLKRLPAFSNTDYTVLIVGPSGSGKEILCQWIHDHSPRKNAPILTINCSALSESLIESELFGHVRGAYTGATEDRKGAFEAARGGTLFLDEIGDLPLSLQPKLLRALENREIRPVGSDRTIKTNVRILAATHKNLREQILKGNFREDLFHRLNICRLSPPALVDRMEDFESLLYAIGKENRVGFSYNAITKLKNHDWPGNIRELKNLVIRAAAYFPGHRIGEDDIDTLIDKPEPQNSVTHLGLSDEDLPPLKIIEKELIIQKLKKFGGNQRKAAEDLQMPKSTLHDKVRLYKINPHRYKARGKMTGNA